MQAYNVNATIENLILTYADAFNASDIDQTVSLFTTDGILMPNNAPLSQGKEQLTASFEFLLKTFRINIGYTIEEINVSGDYAFVRTNSNVATHVKATGEDIFLKIKNCLCYAISKTIGKYRTIFLITLLFPNNHFYQQHII